ncbi:MAG TPA: hypothetical protein VFA15_06055, partial [Nitrososphaera sp.]|nr:hypothetical protein [Nitrososphaera sp.]
MKGFPSGPLLLAGYGIIVGVTLKRHIFVKAFLLALFIAFISLGPFGLSHAMMAMGSAPDSNCPFMPGVTVLCKMGPLEHLAAWQSMFASLPSQNSAFLLLVTLCVLLAQTWRWWKE